MPWPYPCHTHICGPTCKGWPERYCESSAGTGDRSYFWATAMWDRITGRWMALCSEGHRLTGVATDAG